MQADLNGTKVWFNLNHLYYFYVIANEGSMNKASEILLVGAPSLSSQIKLLEQSLGFELFDRSNRRLKMTAKGHTVYEYSHNLFKCGQELLDAVSEVDSKEQKKALRIGVPDNIPRRYILDWFKRCSIDESNLLNIRGGKSADLLKELKQKNLDLLFINHKPSSIDSFSLYSKKVASSPLVICGSSKFKNHLQTFPKSLDRTPIMLPLPGTHSRANIDNFFKKHNVRPTVIGETKDLSMQRIIATEGLAVIIASLASVEDLISNGQLIVVGRPENLTEDIYLLSSSKWSDDPMSQKIISDIYRDHA